jgi:steroid 5-alpha reductase family enzyme
MQMAPKVSLFMELRTHSACMVVAVQKYMQLQIRPKKLITDGMFSYVRHANYFGELLNYGSLTGAKTADVVSALIHLLQACCRWCWVHCGTIGMSKRTGSTKQRYGWSCLARKIACLDLFTTTGQKP